MGSVHSGSRIFPLRGCVVLSSVNLIIVFYSPGANIDHGESDGWTSLHFAAVNGFVEIVDLLLAAGANINLTTVKGQTAKDLALEANHDEVAAKISAASIANSAANTL